MTLVPVFRSRPTRRTRALLSLCVFAVVVIALRRAHIARIRAAAIARGRGWFETRYQLLRAAVAHRVEQQVEVALNSCADHVRVVLKDPAMPQALHRAIDLVLDGLLPDIKHESYRVLDEHLHFLEAARPTNLAPDSRLRSFSPLSPRRSIEHRMKGNALASPSGAARCDSPSGVEPSGSGGTPIVAMAASSTPPTTRQRHSTRTMRGSGGGALVLATPEFGGLGGGDSTTTHGFIDTTTPRLLQLLRRCRATVLHTMWPHNRSLWANLHSPPWWGLQVLGVLPYVGPWWWLLLASAVDKQDEYQLCQFIVALRCSHFVTLGVGGALFGCVQAHRCAAALDEISSSGGDFHNNGSSTGRGGDSGGYVVVGSAGGCRRLAPSLSYYASAFWVAQLLITMRAFLLLPYSKKKGQRVFERRSYLSVEARRALSSGHPPPPAEALGLPTALPGGVLLMRLGTLDLGLAACVLLAAGLAALLSGADVALLRITLFWIRTWHGLLSFPYVLLRLPGANTLLTHARRTGYDTLGHCVPWSRGRGAQ